MKHECFYAVRVFRTHDGKILEKVKREVAIMNLCFSDHTIKHYFSYHHKDELFMFTEFMNEGSLAHFIKIHRK